MLKETVCVLYGVCYYVIVTETRTGVDDYESMDVDVGSGGTGPQRCK